jgi:hypothetical protein
LPALRRPSGKGVSSRRGHNERHHGHRERRRIGPEDLIRKNVIAVYTFNDRDQIRHLDIYEQAKDTGRWIVEAAHDALDAAP